MSYQRLQDVSGPFIYIESLNRQCYVSQWQGAMTCPGLLEILVVQCKKPQHRCLQAVVFYLHGTRASSKQVTQSLPSHGLDVDTASSCRCFQDCHASSASLGTQASGTDW